MLLHNRSILKQIKVRPCFTEVPHFAQGPGRRSVLKEFSRRRWHSLCLLNIPDLVPTYKSSSFRLSEKLWLCCGEPCAGLFHLAEDGCGLIFKKERSRRRFSCLIPVTQTPSTLFLPPTKKARRKLKMKGSECPKPTLWNSSAPWLSLLSSPDFTGSP